MYTYIQIQHVPVNEESVSSRFHENSGKRFGLESLEEESRTRDKKFRWTVRVKRIVPYEVPFSWSASDLFFNTCSSYTRFIFERRSMDYSYLNQAAAAAAAGFEASSCALAASEMQCGYGDLSSCSQMSQAAYRYTAARAAGYPANAGTTSAGSATPLGAHHTTHSHAHAHHGAHTTPCSVMAARSQEVHRHAASIFPSAINLQSECA